MVAMVVAMLEVAKAAGAAGATVEQTCEARSLHSRPHMDNSLLQILAHHQHNDHLMNRYEWFRQ